MRRAKAARTDRAHSPAPVARPASAARSDRGSLHGDVGNQTLLRRLSSTTPRIQRKLTIGAANDPLEAEADHVADQVMRMPQQVSRKCASCDEEDHKLNAKPAGPLAQGDAPPVVHDVLNSPGQPLDAATRTFMEPRLGHSLDQVRVHSDPQAADSASAIGAQAYAAGNHIAFGPGGYTPSSPASQHLMAHELAHVLQQNDAPAVRRVCGPAAIGKPEGCDAGDPVFTPGPTFRFVVNCDDWAGTAGDDLAKFAKGIPAASNVQIDGFASVDGPEPYNSNLACARALKARAALQQAGIPAARITKIVDHGATPGPVADRRSVVVQAVDAPAPPTPATPTPDPTPKQQDTPKKENKQPDKTVEEDKKEDPPPVDAKKPEDPQPRLMVQIPITPLNVQLPIAGPGGLRRGNTSAQNNTALNQAYQPNLAAGLVYSQKPDDAGRAFQIGGFVQLGINTPLPGSVSPLSFSGKSTDFTGVNLQGYLQPAYVFFNKGGYQVSILVQPGIGRTFKSPVPGEDALTYTFQGGFQATKDIIPNRLQFFGSIVGGVNKSILDSPPPGQSASQDLQPFIGISIGIQPVIPLLNYPTGSP